MEQWTASQGCEGAWDCCWPQVRPALGRPVVAADLLEWHPVPRVQSVRSLGQCLQQQTSSVGLQFLVGTLCRNCCSPCSRGRWRATVMSHNRHLPCTADFAGVSPAAGRVSSSSAGPRTGTGTSLAQAACSPWASWPCDGTFLLQQLQQHWWNAFQAPSDLRLCSSQLWLLLHQSHVHQRQLPQSSTASVDICAPGQLAAPRTTSTNCSALTCACWAISNCPHHLAQAKTAKGIPEAAGKSEPWTSAPAPRCTASDKPCPPACKLLLAAAWSALSSTALT